MQYINNIVTDNETWLYFYDVSTKTQNKIRDIVISKDENVLVILLIGGPESNVISAHVDI